MAGSLPRIGTAVLLAGTLCSACASNEDSSTRDASGKVVAGGEVRLDHLRVGDCVTKASLERWGTQGGDTQGTPKSITALAIAPSDQPHGGEVVGVDRDLLISQPQEHPGFETLGEQAGPACVEDIAAYTGFDLDEFVFGSEDEADDEFLKLSDEEIDALTEEEWDKYLGGDEADDPSPGSEPRALFVPFTILPSPETWDQDDRSSICIAISVDDDLTTIRERAGSAKVA